MKRPRETKKAVRRASIALALLNAALAVLLLGSIWGDHAAERSRRDALARRIGADAAQSQTEREEIFAKTVGAALEMVHMRSEVPVTDGRAAIRFYNDAASDYAVELTLVLAQDGSELGRSGRIDPGYYLEELALAGEIAPGDHHCLLRCDFYAVDGGAYLGRAARQLLLLVDSNDGWG